MYLWDFQARILLILNMILLLLLSCLVLCNCDWTRYPISRGHYNNAADDVTLTPSLL